MGGGGYSFQDRQVRAATQNYAKKSVYENFEQRNTHNQMSAVGIIRESCDSEEHPNSVPLIVGLDVTGSMGMVPQMFIINGLPTLMAEVFKAGVKDLQLMIMAIGDHKVDRSPIQVGQFESSDELIDKWLQLIHVESGGGGNGGESYSLAWAFAGYQTKLDCFTKRNQKGFLFTIGDEPVHKEVSTNALQRFLGNGDISTSATEQLKKAQELYHVYHLHLTETGSGSSSRTTSDWKELMGEHCILVNDYNEIPILIGRVMSSIFYGSAGQSNIAQESKLKQKENKESAKPQAVASSFNGEIL